MLAFKAQVLHSFFGTTFGSDDLGLDIVVAALDRLCERLGVRVRRRHGYVEPRQQLFCPRLEVVICLAGVLF